MGGRFSERHKSNSEKRMGRGERWRQVDKEEAGGKWKRGTILVGEDIFRRHFQIVVLSRRWSKNEKFYGIVVKN